MYYINCRVSGGVTGTREGLLKSNGVVRGFESVSEAQAEADRLNTKMNDEHSTAFFSYSVCEYDPWQ